MNRKHKKFTKKSSATEENDNKKQTKITSFFGKPSLSNQEVFKTPTDPIKKINEDKNVIEQSPNDSDDFVSKKEPRRLFGLKQQTSKKLFKNAASTSSLLSGNLEKKATVVHSPPNSKDDFAKKRQLSPEPAK